jgi:hypothetical protein
MKCFLLSLCLLVAGCSTNSNQGSATAQPAGPLKKDPGIDAAVYALQTIDYVEGYVEKPSAMHEVNELTTYATAAVNRIPASDKKLQDSLDYLEQRVGDLYTDRLIGRDTFAANVDDYHKLRDDVLATIKKVAAERNALVELPPVEKLEVAHLPGPKWFRRNDDKKDLVYYQLPAKNSIVYRDSSESKQDKEKRPKLTVMCPAREQVSIWVDAWVETEKVRLKFDNQAPVSETWGATNVTIYSPRSGQLFRQLMKAKTLSIELTPHRSKLQTLAFDLADFKDMPGDDRGCHLH